MPDITNHIPIHNTNFVNKTRVTDKDPEQQKDQKKKKSTYDDDVEDQVVINAKNHEGEESADIADKRLAKDLPKILDHNIDIEA